MLCPAQTNYSAAIAASDYNTPIFPGNSPERFFSNLAQKRLLSWSRIHSLSARSCRDMLRDRNQRWAPPKLIICADRDKGLESVKLLGARWLILLRMEK